MARSNIMGRQQLEPAVSQLRIEVETFNSRLKTETAGIDETQVYAQCVGLVDKCIEKLREWRHVSNYPSFRAHPDDANVLDELQCLFETADKCIKTFEGKMIVMENRKFELDEKLKETTELRQKLLSKCFVMEQNPCQAIVNRDEQESSGERKNLKRKKTDERTKKEKGVKLEMVIRCLLPSYWNEMKPIVTIHDFFEMPDSDESQRKEAKVDITGTEKMQNNGVEIRCRVKDVDNLGIRQQNMYFIKIDFRHSSNSAVVDTLPIGFCCNVSQMPTLSCYLLWYDAVSETIDPCLIQRNFPLSCKLEYLIEVLDSEFHNDESCLAKWVPVLGGPKKTAKTPDINITFSEHNKECLSNMLGAQGHTYRLDTGISKAPWRRGEDIVRFDSFAKEKKFGSKTKFTFWTWFYACYRTIRSHMPNLYAEGLGAGFMTYDQAVETLAEAKSRETPGSEILLLRFTNSYVGTCGSETKYGLVCPTTITAYGEPKRWQAINVEEEKRAKESGIGEVLLEDTKPVGAVKEEYGENLLVLTADGKCVRFAKAFVKFGFRVSKKSKKKFDDSVYTNQMKELLKDLEAASIRSDDGNSNGNSLCGNSSFAMSPTSVSSVNDTIDSTDPVNYGELDTDPQLPSLPHFGSLLDYVGAEPMSSEQSDFLQALKDVQNTMEPEDGEELAQDGWA